MYNKVLDLRFLFPGVGLSLGSEYLFSNFDGLSLHACERERERERERESELVGLFLSSNAVSDVFRLWVISLLRLIDLETAEHRNKVQEKN